MITMSYLVHFDLRAQLSTKDLSVYFALRGDDGVVHLDGFLKADGRREGGGEAIEVLASSRVLASEDVFPEGYAMIAR